jgi:hypothetical protein
MNAARKELSFIIADGEGKTQLALVTGTLGEAQEKAAALAQSRGQPVLLYAFIHSATYWPVSQRAEGSTPSP